MKPKQKKRNTNKFRKSIKEKNRPSKSSILNKGRNIDIVFENIQSKIPSNDSFFESENVILIDSYKNLPKEIVSKVDEYISNFNIRRGFCHYTSFGLSLNIDGVKCCHGWYSDNIYRWYNLLNGNKLSPKYQKEFELIVQLKSQIENGDYFDRYQFIESSSILGESYLDMTNGDFYLTHSWNTYKGIHFDLTGEYLSGDDCELYHTKYMKVVESNILNDENIGNIVKKMNRKYLTNLLTGSGSMEYTVDNSQFHIMNPKYKLVA